MLYERDPAFEGLMITFFCINNNGDFNPNGGLAQLARALALHARGHRFDSDILHEASNEKLKDL